MVLERKLLEEVLQQYSNTSFSLCVGVELEFYIHDIKKELLERWLQTQKETISFALEKEEGAGQFELVFAPSRDILSYADAITRIRSGLLEMAKEQDGEILFHAKPYADSPGSAMHVHTSLFNTKNQNIFANPSKEESDYLLWSVAGLLKDLPHAIAYFADNEADYARYKEPDRNTPATISWGGENRTVALRVPAVGENMQQRRIEHRVPSPRANIYVVFASILYSVLKGIEAKELPEIEKTFGNAWDVQYGLMPFPDSFEEAVHLAKPVI